MAGVQRFIGLARNSLGRSIARRMLGIGARTFRLPRAIETGYARASRNLVWRAARQPLRRHTPTLATLRAASEQAAPTPFPFEPATPEWETLAGSENSQVPASQAEVMRAENTLPRAWQPRRPLAETPHAARPIQIQSRIEELTPQAGAVSPVLPEEPAERIASEPQTPQMPERAALFFSAEEPAAKQAGVEAQTPQMPERVAPFLPAEEPAAEQAGVEAQTPLMPERAALFFSAEESAAERAAPESQTPQMPERSSPRAPARTPVSLPPAIAPASESPGDESAAEISASAPEPFASASASAPSSPAGETPPASPSAETWVEPPQSAATRAPHVARRFAPDASNAPKNLGEETDRTRVETQLAPALPPPPASFRETVPANRQSESAPAAQQEPGLMSRTLLPAMRSPATPTPRAPETPASPIQMGEPLRPLGSARKIQRVEKMEPPRPPILARPLVAYHPPRSYQRAPAESAEGAPRPGLDSAAEILETPDGDRLSRAASLALPRADIRPHRSRLPAASAKIFAAWDERAERDVPALSSDLDAPTIQQRAALEPATAAPADASSEPPSPATASATTPRVGATAEGAPGADLDTVARQVYQILRRRLQVELERSRGWSGR